jgi:medium-chain acyl-[acyl-carrier-protein] hydrolase
VSSLKPIPAAQNTRRRGAAFDIASNATARLRLFCFPYAGGSAAIFRAWPSVFPAEIQICPAQLPGRQWRFVEPSFTRVDPLVEALHEELRQHLDRPFALFGHSMGAILAYELARRLELDGHRPRCLFVSGRRAPQQPREHEGIHALPDDQFRDRLRALEGTPEEILSDPEAMDVVQEILRADFEVCETYEYREGAPLTCAVSAFGGLRDAHVSQDDLQAWRAQTRGYFRLRMFDGSHFFLHQVEAAVQQAILEDLRRAMVTV